MTTATVFKNYQGIIEQMLHRFRKISFIGLDYNLGTVKTCYDVLVYMKEHGIDVNHINIHSDHIPGSPKTREYALEIFPNIGITFNPL